MGKYIHANPKKHIAIKDVIQVYERNLDESWVKSLIVCLYYFGLRISEALALEPRNFDIFIDKKSKRKFLQVHSPTLKNKTHTSRTLFVPYEKPLVADLYYYAKICNTVKVWNYSRQWARVKIQRALPEVSPHVFRHNRLTEFAQLGGTEFQLESWAGWSDARPAKDYVDPVENRRTAEILF